MREEVVNSILNNEGDIFNEKIDKLISSFDYYQNLIEDLKNLFIEYEVYDNIVCFSSCDIDNETNIDNIDIKYNIKIISGVNIFKFNAVDFNNKDTKFNITIFKDEEEIDKYVLDTLEDVKNNIIKWLICCI